MKSTTSKENQLVDGDVATAIAAGELIEHYRAEPRRAEVLHSKPFVILRDGETEKVVYVDEQFDHPTFRKGIVQLKDAPSFIAYFAEHKNANSSIFATLDPCQFTAVLDEHPPGQLGAAQWREFRATFAPSLSKEWAAWIGHNGPQKPFESTEAFAHFIEDNAPDFVDPDAVQMLEMATNFKVSQAATYKAVQRLQDGNMDFQYVNEVNGTAGGSSVKVPERFTIEIPLFAGPTSPTYRIEARFRFRLTNGTLKLWYDLMRPHKVLENAFKDIYVQVGDGTNTTILLGTTD